MAVQDLPHSLRHIFHLLRFVKARGDKLFSNGAGKSGLLAFSAHFEFGCTIHSTTNDPRSDWCGIKGVGGVSGVADVVLQNIGGERLVVGEVKLTPEGRGEGIPGESQLLAELKTALHVYLPRSTRKGNFRLVRSFDEVLGGLDIVFGFLVEVGTCIASHPLTPEGGELREES